MEVFVGTHAAFQSKLCIYIYSKTWIALVEDQRLQERGCCCCLLSLFTSTVYSGSILSKIGFQIFWASFSRAPESHAVLMYITHITILQKHHSFYHQGRRVLPQDILSTIDLGEIALQESYRYKLQIGLASMKLLTKVSDWLTQPLWTQPHVFLFLPKAQLVKVPKHKCSPS